MSINTTQLEPEQTQLNNFMHPITTESFQNQIPELPAIFADDVENRLGRANGNVYISKSGVDQVHDGQIMVRLKKKRFIIIDYSMPFDSVPGSEKRICIAPNCNKIGVPTLLYDSVPSEQASLYLRSGLCFTCQRAHNEKRRTQRKRKSDEGGVRKGASNNKKELDGKARKKITSVSSAANEGNPNRPNFVQSYTVGDQVISLPNDAIIICGPLEGTRRAGPDYCMKDISNDIRQLSNGIVNDTDRLLTLVEKAAAGSNVSCKNIFSSDYTAALSIDGNKVESKLAALGSFSNPQLLSSELKFMAEKSLLDFGETDTSMSIPLSSQVDAHYEKAMLTMKKSIFLLSQWKSSWDSIERHRIYKQQQQQKEELIVSSQKQNSITAASGNGGNISSEIAALAQKATANAAIEPTCALKSKFVYTVESSTVDHYGNSMNQTNEYSGGADSPNPVVYV